MASSSLACFNIATNPKCCSYRQFPSSCPKKTKECSSLHGRTRSSRSESRKRSTKRYLIVRNATPEVAAAASDVLSSLSIPGISGFSFPGDNPLLTGAAGLFIVVPIVIQRLMALTKQVDMAAQTIEKIADTVGKVAEEVDKAAEDMVDKLPDGGLKKVAIMVEHMAEETVKDAQKVEDLMDKIEELDDKVEEFLTHQLKGAEKNA